MSGVHVIIQPSELYSLREHVFACVRESKSKSSNVVRSDRWHNVSEFMTDRAVTVYMYPGSVV